MFIENVNPIPIRNTFQMRSITYFLTQNGIDILIHVKFFQSVWLDYSMENVT